MPDLGVQFLNTPFAFEPYQPGVPISLSGCIFTQSREYPESIRIETLDMQGNQVPGCKILDLDGGVIYHGMNPILSPDLPAMYYALPKAPSEPGTYQLKVSVTYPSGVISPRMRTIQVFKEVSSQATSRAADLPGTKFQLKFDRPKENAKLASNRAQPITCTTRITRRSAYGYFLLIDETTKLIAATSFHKTWVLGVDDCQMTTVIRPPDTADGPYSLVAYILEMNQGTILESRSQSVRMQKTASVLNARSIAIRDAIDSTLPMHVPDPRLDLNSATERELVAIPGIGKALAKRIVKARPFATPEELASIDRFPQGKLGEILTYLCVAQT